MRYGNSVFNYVSYRICTSIKIMYFLSLLHKITIVLLHIIFIYISVVLYYWTNMFIDFFFLTFLSTLKRVYTILHSFVPINKKKNPNWHRIYPPQNIIYYLMKTLFNKKVPRWLRIVMSEVVCGSCIIIIITIIIVFGRAHRRRVRSYWKCVIILEGGKRPK